MECKRFWKELLHEIGTAAQNSYNQFASCVVEHFKYYIRRKLYTSVALHSIFLCRRVVAADIVAMHFGQTPSCVAFFHTSHSVAKWAYSMHTFRFVSIAAKFFLQLLSLNFFSTTVPPQYRRHACWGK